VNGCQLLALQLFFDDFSHLKEDIIFIRSKNGINKQDEKYIKMSKIAENIAMVLNVMLKRQYKDSETYVRVIKEIHKEITK